ncbi:LmbE family N-acetylglucosaminyl deacetylase [Beijerinckiaceae bacterium RH AL1]|nr:PIG-L family deacetylase [Beijerinckiaceae bacterium]VVB49138.1 LmbE family N-acetylglucosaminyl deacetylase [Beijerinckiaceae bacterium RH CH11]VVB49217.1 LmbE family N-acetylglucosaminyl deacetylase [Beijerinckiaceae bacterium RH AL8]VVC56747.1 LmbE family N-acetylglucosaminyl deacetylase [Beijerinckiaceae bacterium RH AL1]
MPTALAISPHLDDAIFSAGGTLARLSELGWRVIVATVFTASVPYPQGFALACQLDKGLAADIDYMALRREEDRQACAAIGAEPIWLPFREAPHRGYHSANDLFAGLLPTDDIVAEIAPHLEELSERYEPDLVLAPQAIGAHVDHVATFLALHRGGSACWLWTDAPYATRPAARPSPFLLELDSCERRVVTLDAAASDRKVSAALSYASQLPFQFGGVDAARATLSKETQESFLVLDASDGRLAKMV